MDSWTASVQFSHSVMSTSLWPHGLQHARPPHPSPTPRACSIHVHRVSEAIQTSHPLSSPSPAFNLSQHHSLFNMLSRLAVAFCPRSKRLNFILQIIIQFSSVAQLCPTLRPHEPQHAKPPCPSPTPGVYSNSRPSSRTPPNPSQHQGLFQWVNFLHQAAKVLELQLQHQ